MTDCVTVHAPLEINRIDRSRLDADTVALRLGGRWLDQAAADEQELLVVQVDGRRHRFPGARDEQLGDQESWSATFILPAWAEPRREGQAALWIGNSVITVPGAAPTGPGVAPAGPGVASAAPRVVPGGAVRVGDSAPAEAPRSGPLADLLLKETVAALHAELEQRTGDAARMRGALADAQSELEARKAMQAALEATHSELRVELERLTSAVERRRAEFDARVAESDRERADAGRQLVELKAALDDRAGEVMRAREQLAGMQAAADQGAAANGRLCEELAAVTVARDAAVSEIAGLRTELERLGTALAATRERVGAEGGDLGSAHRLLADARALAEELRGQGGGM